jgi:hypothetical protein
VVPVSYQVWKLLILGILGRWLALDTSMKCIALKKKSDKPLQNKLELSAFNKKKKSQTRLGNSEFRRTEEPWSLVGVHGSQAQTAD